MKNITYIIGFFLALVVITTSCKEDTYEFGDLIAPSNVVINADIIGQTASSPDGDGSGEVIITLSADNAITYHIGFNKIEDYGDVSYSVLPTGTLEKKFTDPGVNTYRISVIAFGTGGSSTNVTKDITVRSDYVPDPAIVTAITNDASKTWIVNKDVPGHFGVAPWDGAYSPIWWAAGVDEKLDCCSCFYSTTFTFTKNGTSYTLDVNAPEGAFTKTGDLSFLPGIPDSGDEGCYTEYSGGSSGFNFVPASSGAPLDTPSTQVSMKMESYDVYIGYGALLDEYEILEFTTDYLYLRIQGTETGNSWYLKLKPAP